jgi:nucleoside 2-deoxyribosyltransferase
VRGGSRARLGRLTAHRSQPHTQPRLRPRDASNEKALAGMMRTPQRRRIYLAGPEVFLPHAAELGAEKCRLVAAAGFDGVFPHDPKLKAEPSGKGGGAQRIFAANTALLASCDALIANLTPFRGVSADAGTVFELGFFFALRRPIAAYTNTPESYHARATAFRARPAALADADRPECEIEDHDLSDNLMLEMAVIASGSRLIRHVSAGAPDMADLTAFRQCLNALARQLTS